jgi:large subunit ribosomal protein L6e
LIPLYKFYICISPTIDGILPHNNAIGVIFPHFEFISFSNNQFSFFFLPETTNRSNSPQIVQIPQNPSKQTQTGIKIMAKISAARKAHKKATKNTLSKACKALAGRGDKTGVAKLRKSITPGTVLILLAGAHKGKRVVFIRQLKSGLLLVTGLVKINGVPARRVNQSYVIATSTKVELPAGVVSAAEKLDDVFFAKAKKTAQRQNRFVAPADAPVQRKKNEERVAAQKTIEAALKPAVVAMGKDFVSYIGSKFTLGKTTIPHKMKF